MAYEDRLRLGGMEGTLAADLTTGATTIDFGSDPGASRLSRRTDHIALIIDGTEIVHPTAFTSGNTTGTIQRAREGTSDPGTSYAIGTGMEARPDDLGLLDAQGAVGRRSRLRRGVHAARPADDAAERMDVGQSGQRRPSSSGMRAAS